MAQPSKKRKLEKITVCLLEGDAKAPLEWDSEADDELCFHLAPDGQLKQSALQCTKQVQFPKTIQIDPQCMDLANQMKQLILQGSTCKVFSPDGANFGFEFGQNEALQISERYKQFHDNIFYNGICKHCETCPFTELYDIPVELENDTELRYKMDAIHRALNDLETYLKAK